MKDANRTGSPECNSSFMIATVDSLTQRGGEVVTGREGHFIGEHKVACVGDVVRYSDGSESLIVSGAGYGAMIDDLPMALVGSHVANGDRVVSSPQDVVAVTLDGGSDPIVGFLEPGFLPARQEPNR